jgi:hypothetical protein
VRPTETMNIRAEMYSVLFIIFQDWFQRRWPHGGGTARFDDVEGREGCKFEAVRMSGSVCIRVSSDAIVRLTPSSLLPIIEANGR